MYSEILQHSWKSARVHSTLTLNPRPRLWVGVIEISGEKYLLSRGFPFGPGFIDPAEGCSAFHPMVFTVVTDASLRGVYLDRSSVQINAVLAFVLVSFAPLFYLLERSSCVDSFRGRTLAMYT